MNNFQTDHPGMVKRPVKPRARPQRAPLPLFLGQWLRALGIKQVDVVRGTTVSEGYVSQLVSGEKKNPNPAILNEIADFLGIPLHYLRRPPPPKEFLQEVGALDPAVIERLRAAGR